MNIKYIRNFSIIAHIDHGKSTFSDKIIQICGNLKHQYKKKNRILDSMEIEKEKGITIKARNVTLKYKSKNKKIYQFNFIDTPGHVDFSYEVFRSLNACEGVLLLIDAKRGIEAQTIAHYNTALKMKLNIIFIFNKIDLPNINYKKLLKKANNIFNINENDIIFCSAKKGIGIQNTLEKIIKKFPHPTGNNKNTLQALIIDSWFDNYFGIIYLICIKNGKIKKGDKIKTIGSKKNYTVERLGIFNPEQIDLNQLNCGEVGWIICRIRKIQNSQIGDTITHTKKPSKKALIKFKKIKPKIYASLFPVKKNEYEKFKKALIKLQLNDFSLYYETEESNILGYGFRCGFLGMLHMEIIQERLKREYNLKIITTAPKVIHEIHLKNKKIIYIDNPSKIPKKNKIKEFRIPIAKCNIFTPKKYIGKIISLCIKKNGIQKNIIYSDKEVQLTYEIPLSEIILDFFDKIKSISQGYASLNYYFIHFKKTDMVNVNILINSKIIDDLGFIVEKKNAIYKSKKIIENIKKIIPRQQFEINIQASIGKKIISSSKIKQLRKNVTIKCYGGDVSRKKKLLEKQKKGKKNMKKIGNVIIPKEVFLTTLNIHKNYNINKENK